MSWLAGVLFRILFRAVALRRPPDQVIYSYEGHPYLLRWFLFGKRRDGSGKSRMLPGGRTLYLHCFVSSDDDRALHDHPADFRSFILRGGYDELVPASGVQVDGQGTMDYSKCRTFLSTPCYAGEYRFSRAAEPHRIALFRRMGTPNDNGAVMELLYKHGANALGGITYNETTGEFAPHVEHRLKNYQPCWTLFYFGKRYREWGFWCRTGWVHWRKFEANGGCDG